MMVVLYLLVAVGVAYGLYRYFPTATKRWFRRIKTARKAVFSTLFAVTTLILLISGVSYLVVLGISMAVLAALQIILEDPLEVF
ncbi:hypothetical protein [Natrinema pallidum]|uniref:Uncharacterized protein n=2 Tax=Natrinema pallidum TaxID=69527 RepID=A0A4V1IFJ7_9EURY|nr:hypothetical protein FGF80_18470 [Natrinema pallidum]